LVVLIGTGMIVGALVLAPARVRVPDVRGMHRGRVLLLARRLGFHATFSRRYSETAPGQAINQSPVPGTRVARGTTVEVVLSAGPPPAPLPKIIGTSLSDAETVLRALNLRAVVRHVPAPGVAPGTVTDESPAAGTGVAPGSAVEVSVAETPQLRYVTSLAGDGTLTSPSLRIRGTRWELVYSMSYEGMCAFIFVCSGPSAQVTSDAGTTVDSFDLAEGDRRTRIERSGPGVYQIQISPGSDDARWRVTVDDYY
jgi:hypothetical protein